MDDKAATDDLRSFLDHSPTSRTAVDNLVRMLEDGGFEKLDEGERWEPRPLRGYYVRRSGGSIIAFRVGGSPPAESGCRIVGAHTDAPGFRLKPGPFRGVGDMVTLPVEVYGSPILSTWFDRDLSVAGELVVAGEGGLRPVPFVSRRPVCRMCTPAIHLERTINKEGFKVDAERHTPLLVSLDGTGRERLMELAASEAGVPQEDVAGWSVHLWDPQRAEVGGLDGSLLLSGRIDDLTMCHAGVDALLATCDGDHTAVVALFDNEEIGSRTRSGAGSEMLASTLERLAGDREGYMRCLAGSILVSADGAHGLHPNYQDRHDPSVRPLLGGGPVIKVSAQGKYTSDGLSSAYFERCAEATGAPVQYFVGRNDMPSGTTIGPITAAGTGMLSVDVGCAMLSMHSVREAASTKDQRWMRDALLEHLGGGPAMVRD